MIILNVNLPDFNFFSEHFFDFIYFKDYTKLYMNKKINYLLLLVSNVLDKNKLI